MSEKQTNFRKLSEAVISGLKALGYMDSSITNYRRLFARIGTFMNDRSIENYSPEVGKDFVAKHYPADSQRRRMVLLMIRRLDDYMSNVPYRCHHAMKAADVPAEFAQLLDDYLAYCTEIGNKPGTVDTKKRFCLIFLQFLSEKGCKDISSITAGIVAKSCLKYSNNIDLIQQKTEEPLSVFMPDDVSSALREHIESADGHLSDGCIFHSMKAPYGKLTTSIIRHIVHECIVSAGIDVKGRKHGPHALRSSLASNLVSSGTSYDTVRKILGHSDTNAVKHYVKTDIERLRKCALEPPEPSGIFLDLLCGRRCG